MRSAQLCTKLIIGAHPHRHPWETRAVCELLQKREVRPGRLIHGRDRHQALQFSGVGLAGIIDQLFQISRKDAWFALFLAGIHLDRKVRKPVQFRSGLAQRAYDLLAVHRLNHVKQRDGVFRLVALKRTDEMKGQTFNIPPVLPVFLRFLDPVLAKDALAAIERRLKALIGLLL